MQISDELRGAVARAICCPSGACRRETTDEGRVFKIPCDAVMRLEQADAALTAALPMIRAQVVEERHGFCDLVARAYVEADKAMRKFPQPTYVISKVAEEAGEVVKAAIHCAENRETAENVAGEMKQLIAMLYRLWTEGDQVHGLPPIAAAIRNLKWGGHE